MSTSEWNRSAQSFTYFFKNYIYINSPSGVTKLQPYEYQNRTTEEMQHNKHLLIKTPRQMGNSLMCNAFTLWKALFESDQTIINMTATVAMCGTSQSDMMFMYGYLPDFMKCKITKNIKGSGIEFANGSRITFLNSLQQFRGMSKLDLIVVSDASIIKNFEYNVILPCLRNDTRIVITSLYDGEFADLWDAAEPIDDFDRFLKKLKGHKTVQMSRTEIKWNEHPDRDDEWIQNILARSGTYVAEVEYGYVS